MKKVRIGRIGCVAVAALTLSLAGCSFASKIVDEQELNDISGALEYADVSRMAYMGGSVFYNPKAPSEGQLYEGTTVAVRLGKIKEVKADTEETIVDYTTFCDIPAEEQYGYITVDAISADRIKFTYTSLNERGVIEAKDVVVNKGETADINGDNLADVKYDVPEVKRAGFEKAVYLTFISSKEDLYTSMFAVIPDQYSRGAYPSGVMGINPDGKFIVTKYEGESTERAALKGVCNGDFILDGQAGKYLAVENASSFKNARAIEDSEIDGYGEVMLEDVFPLLSLTVIEDEDETIGTDENRAAIYTEYDAERNAIEKEFSTYLSWNVLPEKWKMDKRIGDMYAKIGIRGTFHITWKNVESTLSAAACVKFEINPGYETYEKGYYFEKPLEFLNWNKTIQIGIIPFSIGVDGKANIGYEKRTVVDWDFCAGFIGMFGGTVTLGANYGISWFRPYINPYAKYTPINRTSYFFGIKSGGVWTPTKIVDSSIIPEVEITPKVGVANNTVWVGVGIYDAVKLRKYSIENLRTRAYTKDTYIYNKFGMSLKCGFNLLGKSTAIPLLNLTPSSDFVEILHWSN